MGPPSGSPCGRCCARKVARCVSLNSIDFIRELFECRTRRDARREKLGGKNSFPGRRCLAVARLAAIAYTEKNGFVTATKVGTTNKIFVAATKHIAATTKRFVDRTKRFCFCKKIFLLSLF